MCIMTPHKFPFRHHHGSSINTRFAHRFLRALKKLNHRRSANETAFRRYRRVKLASYTSMAVAVGSRRAWSRAMLWKVRINQGLTSTRSTSAKRSRIRNPRNNIIVGDIEEGKELRDLVPGGEVMDFCSLLDETAHYIKCLSSQVEIMRNIVDYYSP